MATVLTEPAVDEATVHVSFPILKWEQDEDGDLVVKGIATDGTVDHDEQIVDPVWSAKALDDWIGSGGNVRMSHNPQRPVGKGLKVEVDKDGTGKHWVTSVIVDRDAQRLIKKGVLTAYSVGISRPVIQHDPTGRARGGIISGGEMAEISVVDRPSNKSSYLQLAKAAADGTCEFTGKMVGDTAELLEKAAESDATKSIATAEPASMDAWTPPGEMDISFTPNDMMRLMQSKFVEKHYDDLAVEAVKAAEAQVYKRDIDTASRRQLAADGKALPNLSYPIENTGDLGSAATLARSGHGDVAAARRLIARRAKELGVANPLDEGDVKKSIGEAGMPSTPEEQLLHDIFAEKSDAPAEAAAKEAEPELTKDPEPEDKPKSVKKAKKKAKGGKKMPPWLDKPSGETDDSPDDDGACKMDHAHTEKCHTTPAEAAGVTAAPMQAAPIPELQESPPTAAMKASPTPQSASAASEAPAMTPVPQHREPDGAIVEPFEHDAKLPATGQGETPTKLEAPMMKGQPEVSAMLRFKTVGIDPDMGRLHDLTCPAYHPDEVAKYHPFADLSSVIDDRDWMRKALAAASGPTDVAMAMTQMWNAVSVLKAADAAVLNDFRLEAHKAFRDANPGPSAYPTPGSISPQRFSRPLVTDGHEASSPGHDGPNSSPDVASNAPDAHSFDRPPLSAGHQSPSPSFMKGSGGEYPASQGAPVQLHYAHMEKDQARMALVRAHDQLSRQFPEVCPMDTPDYRPLRGQQPESHPVPAVAGAGKSEAQPEVAKAEVAAAAEKAAPEADGRVMDAKVYKGFKKARKKLGKKVLAGKITVDEARAKMGRQFAQKGSTEQEDVLKSAELPASLPDAGIVYNVSGNVDPAVIKAAVAEALHANSVPLEPATIAPFDPSPAIEAAVTKAVTPLLEKIQAQDTKLAETQRVIDAIADQPDPSTATFSGLAFRNPVIKSAGPVGIPDRTEIAARTQDMIRRNLQNTYYTHSSPAVREAAGQELAKQGWEPSMT